MSTQDQPDDQQDDDGGSAGDTEATPEDAGYGVGGDTDKGGDGGESEGDDTGDGVDGGDDESGEEQEPPTDEERLEQLGERIDEARSQAEDAGVLGEEEDEREFVDSGATEDQDDQEIAPPG